MVGCDSTYVELKSSGFPFFSGLIPIRGIGGIACFFLFDMVPSLQLIAQIAFTAACLLNSINVQQHNCFHFFVIVSFVKVSQSLNTWNSSREIRKEVRIRFYFLFSESFGLLDANCSLIPTRLRHLLSLHAKLSVRFTLGMEKLLC